MNMRSFSAVLLAGLFLLISIACLPKPTAAQQPDAPPRPQNVVASQPLWVTTMVNEPQVKRLAEAISLTYALVPEFRPLADAAARKKTAVRWGDLGGAIGAYYRQTNTIVLD